MRPRLGLLAALLLLAGASFAQDSDYKCRCAVWRLAVGERRWWARRAASGGERQSPLPPHAVQDGTRRPSRVRASLRPFEFSRCVCNAAAFL